VGESDLSTVAVKGDNENTNATEGQLSICQSSRKVTTLEAGRPQESFIGQEGIECTDFLHIPEASYMFQQILKYFI